MMCGRDLMWAVTQNIGMCGFFSVVVSTRLWLLISNIRSWLDTTSELISICEDSKDRFTPAARYGQKHVYIYAVCGTYWNKKEIEAKPKLKWPGSEMWDYIQYLHWDITGVSWLTAMTLLHPWAVYFLCSCVNVTIVSNLLCNEKKGYRSWSWSISHHNQFLRLWIFGMCIIVVGFRDLASSKEAFKKNVVVELWQQCPI